LEKIEMKKTLVALAALASVSAFAQSTVEIYGVLDVAQTKLSGIQAGLNNTTNSYPVSQSSTALLNGFARQGTGTNHMGFRSREDLGGGNYAGFDLQTGGLDMSNGNPGLAFSRESHLKLGGSWGDLKVGRTVSTICSIGCSFDLNYIGANSAFGLLGLSPANNKGSSRRSDLIDLTLPAFNGFQAKVSLQQRGDQNADGTFVTSAGAAYTTASTASGASTTVANYKDVVTIGGTYSSGPLRIAAAMETPASDSLAMRNATFAAAEYNFGFMKATVQSFTNTNKGGSAAPNANNSATVNTTGLYTLSTNAGTTTYGKGTGFGVIVPMGAWNVGMQYANNSETKVKANEVFARYSLSKRTEIYVQTTSLSGAAATTATAAGLTASSALGLTALQADPKISALGIRHTF